MSFIAELLEWFEIKKPDFVQPIQAVDLTGVSLTFQMFENHTSLVTVSV